MSADQQEILPAVRCAANLDEALEIIVRRVRDSLQVDVCAIYLTDVEAGHYVLMASNGSSRRAGGVVCIDPPVGLLGLVGERRELVVLSKATTHPRYQFSAEAGDEELDTFIGMPLIHQHRMLGVLVAWRQGHAPLVKEEVTFFVTVAAQLSEAVHEAAKAEEFARLLEGVGDEKAFIQGVQAAAGVAVGAATLVVPPDGAEPRADRDPGDRAAEESAFTTAIAAAQAELRASSARVADVVSDELRSLFDVYVMLIGSDSLVTDTVERIRAGCSAARAWRDTIADRAMVFDRMDDAYLRARGDDIREVGHRVVLHLREGVVEPRQYPQRCILVADSVGITDIAAVPTGRLVGIVCKQGSVLSHTAILAHALGIPAVVSLSSLPAGLIEGCRMVVDGDKGRVFVNPSQAVVEDCERRAAEQQALRSRLAALRDLPARTLDGVELPLYANIGLACDVDAVRQCAAAGVGLVRTEYQFLLGEAFPIEDEQYQVYRDLLVTLAPKPVVIRTLDVGGDKILKYFPLAEENPFLGCRGIRFSLAHPEIFLIQLRALLRANAGLGNLQVLFPMVSRVAELDQALALLTRAHGELLEEGQASAMPRVGVMIEVPSAVFLAGALAERVDFLSIGTNDLAQYTLAADRTNCEVATPYDALHPAVLHAIGRVVQDAHQRNTPVNVCGEMAGDPAGALVLLGMGVDALSMSPGAVPHARLVIRSFTARQARELAERALGLQDGSDVFALLRDALETADVLQPGGKRCRSDDDTPRGPPVGRLATRAQAAMPEATSR